MKIRQRRQRSGNITFQLDLGKVDGKRKQPSYKTLDQAEKALAKAMATKEKHGKAGLSLTRKDLADVTLAMDKLSKLGASLLQAADFYVMHHGMGERISLDEMMHRFRDSRAELKRSERYIRQLKVSIGSLAALYPGVMADEVTKAKLEEWLANAEWEAGTRENYLGDVAAMYNWAVKKKLVAQSPCKDIDLPEDEGTEDDIERLPLEACRALLEAAREHPKLMPYLVLALFCGIRPAEIGRMDWSMVDLEDRIVMVPARMAKTRKRRTVDLSANAVAWLLEAGAPGEGKIVQRGFTDQWASLRRGLGWRVGDDNTLRTRWRQESAKMPITRGEWPHDGLRHTYASMHYAHHQNEDALQAQMGHESGDVLFSHYRGLVKRVEAMQFWEHLWPYEWGASCPWPRVI